MTARVYHPYTEWEDWQNGMWRSCVATTMEIEQAGFLLSQPILFGNAAREMLRAWPKAAEHNLTNPEQNRRAWIGQATCAHRVGASESATRLAWWSLSEAARDTANATAETVLAGWAAARDLTLFGDPYA